MFVRNFFLLFVGIFLPFFINSQTYHFERFKIKEGLPSLQIMDADTDRYGNIWLATLSGGVMFNGKTFKQFTFENDVSEKLYASVKVSPDNDVLFGTWKGKIARLSGDTIKTVDLTQRIGAVMAIRWLAPGKPVLYTTKGIFSLTNDTVLTLIYPSEQERMRLYPLKTEQTKNYFWVINKNGFLFQFDKHHRFLKKIALPTICHSIYANNDKVYLGGFGQLFVYEKDSLFTFPIFRQDSLHYITAITQDRYGNTWLGVSDNAIYYLPKNGNRNNMIRIGKENGLPKGKITKLLVLNNQLWVTTDGNGIYCLTNFAASYLLSQKNPPVNIMDIVPFKQGLALATDREVYYYIPATGTLEYLTEIHPALLINDLAAQGDSIFIASNNDFYLYRYDTKKIISLSAEKKAPFDVFYFAENINNIIYFGGEKTFNKIENGDITTFKGEDFIYVRTLIKINDTLFLKGGQHLWAFLQKIDYDSVAARQISKSLSLYNNITIYDICKISADEYLAGGENFLYRVMLQDDSVAVEKINVHQVLGLNKVLSLFYRQDTLYVLGEHQMICFSYRKFLQQKAPEIIYSLNEHNGFSSVANDKALYVSPDGMVYIGTADGLLMFRQEKQRQPIVTPPALLLENVKLFNQPLDWQQYTDSIIDKIGIQPVFDYNDNNLSFYFSSTSLILRKNIMYRYRLVGYDSVWSMPTASPYISYASLPPGNYTLQAQAGLNTVWSLPYSYTFQILPPFWQTPWFYTLIVLLLMALIGGIFNYRTRQLKRKMERQKRFTKAIIVEQEKERKRIAKDLHDSIGQQLLLIKNKAAGHSEISQMVKNTIEEVRSISRNIHPLHLEKFGLQKTLQHISEKLSETTGIFVTYELDFDNEKLTETQQITIYRMTQEIFNNIIKHAQATGVKVEAFINKVGEFVLIIKDNGIGFDQKEKTNTAKSMGLSGLYERASLINGKLTIQSNPGKGTTITLLINIE